MVQYVAFVVTAFTNNFGWAFFSNASFHHFAVRIFSFGIAMDITL